MSLAAIMAISDDGAIGHDNRVPWNIGPDLEHFKKVTMGHPIIMGRKTFESIGRPLKGRRNIVVTRHPNPIHLIHMGIGPKDIFDDPFNACIDALEHHDEPYVIGGAAIYHDLWEHVTKLWLTEVHLTYPEADVRFDFDRGQWNEVERTKHPGFDFVLLERAGAVVDPRYNPRRHVHG